MGIIDDRYGGSQGIVQDEVSKESHEASRIEKGGVDLFIYHGGNTFIYS